MMTTAGVGVIILGEFLLLMLLAFALLKLTAWDMHLGANKAEWLAQLRNWRREMRHLRHQTARWPDTLPLDLKFLLPAWLQKGLTAYKVIRAVAKRA